MGNPNSSVPSVFHRCPAGLEMQDDSEFESDGRRKSLLSEGRVRFRGGLSEENTPFPRLVDEPEGGHVTHSSPSRLPLRIAASLFTADF